jgi:hypothetical protein
MAPLLCECGVCVCVCVNMCGACIDTQYIDTNTHTYTHTHTHTHTHTIPAGNAEESRRRERERGAAGVLDMAKAWERESEADERSPIPKFSKVNVLVHVCCEVPLQTFSEEKSCT